MYKKMVRKPYLRNHLIRSFNKPGSEPTMNRRSPDKWTRWLEWRGGGLPHQLVQILNQMTRDPRVWWIWASRYTHAMKRTVVQIVLRWLCYEALRWFLSFGFSPRFCVVQYLILWYLIGIIGLTTCCDLYMGGLYLYSHIRKWSVQLCY